MANPNGGVRVVEPAGHRERVASPQSPDKTEHAWNGAQLARELGRVTKTKPAN